MRTDDPSPYDHIAALYDPWSRSVTEDIAFYVEEARKSAGAAGAGHARRRARGRHRPDRRPDRGRGRARDRRRLVRRDAGGLPRPGADEAGVSELLDLRLGDLRDPPVDERVALVTCPFRAYLHLEGEADRLRALEAARSLLLPGGRLIFDVFTPSAEGHRGHAGPLAGARAGDLGARRLGRGRRGG